MAKQHRIGILGGAYDPIHEGHIRLGTDVLDAGLVDELLVIPSGRPPHKNCVAEAEDRWKMVVAACARDKRLRPSRIEIDRPGTTYAADTLLALKAAFPGSSLLYIIGEDALLSLRTWHHAEIVFSLCSFLVCRRPGVPRTNQAAEEIQRLESMGAKLRYTETEPFAISSTQIRDAFSRGEFTSSLSVPVQEYCACKGLYGLPRRLEQIDGWMDRLFASLKPKRFAHSLSVAFTASRLARIHGLDPLRAEQAGLLHDCAKSFPLEEMQHIAAEHSLDCDEAFLSSGALLHSVAGAAVAERDYGMKDPQVLDAIACHNTGRTGMSRLSMCVCLADSIEPLREDFPGLPEIRRLAESSLERALLLSLEKTSEYVLSRGLYLHPKTRETIRWLRSLPAVSGS